MQPSDLLRFLLRRHYRGQRRELEHDAPTHDAPRANGMYVPGLSLAIAQVEVIAWFAEAFLHTHESGAVDLDVFLNSPSSFPFRLSPVSAAHLVAVSARLDVLRHGLDQDLIMLRTETLPALRRGGS